MTIIRRRLSLRRSRSSRHSSSVPLPSLMEDYLAHLELRDKALTAVNRQSALRDLAPWMTKHGIDPLRATTEQLQAYQQHGDRGRAGTQPARQPEHDDLAGRDLAIGKTPANVVGMCQFVRVLIAGRRNVQPLVVLD